MNDFFGNRSSTGFSRASSGVSTRFLRTQHLWVAIVILLSFFSVNALHAQVTNGLEGWWTFDDGTAKDNSGNAHNGDMHSMVPTTDRFGRTNSAMSFDGTSSWIEIPASDRLKMSQAVTLAAWIKRADMNRLDEIVVSSTGTTFSYGMRIQPENTFQALFYKKPSWVATNTSTTIDIEWHHVCATIDSGVMVLYVDGIASRTNSNVGSLPGDGDGRVGIGFCVNNGKYFQGLIDDVRIYRRALSASEVGTLAASWLHGELQYSGNMPGLMQVVAESREGLQQFTQVGDVGPFELPVRLDMSGPLSVSAFKDVNANGVRDAFEPFGVSPHNPVTVQPPFGGDAGTIVLYDSGHLFTAQGRCIYTGRPGGTLRAALVTGTNRLSIPLMPDGSFLVTNLVAGAKYNIESFLDINTNRTMELWEPRGILGPAPFLAVSDITVTVTFGDDRDGDGIDDVSECLTYGTSPDNPDSDGDGLPDGWEVANGLNPLLPDAGFDADLDGLTNGQEYEYSRTNVLGIVLSPRNRQSTTNGVTDSEFVNGSINVQYAYDRNDRLLGAQYGNGLVLLYQYDANGNIVRQLTTTQDTSGVPLLWKLSNGLTNKTVAREDYNDSDGDGWSDYQEWLRGTDPCNAASTPGYGPRGRLLQSFDASFPARSFVMGSGQLDDGGFEQIAISADAETQVKSNVVRLLSWDGHAWQGEDILIGAFGVTSLAVGKVGSNAGAVYAGVRGWNGSAGILEIQRVEGGWITNVVLRATNGVAWVHGISGDRRLLVSGGFTNDLAGVLLAGGKTNGAWSFSTIDSGIATERPGTSQAWGDEATPQQTLRWLNSDALATFPGWASPPIGVETAEPRLRLGNSFTCVCYPRGRDSGETSLLMADIADRDHDGKVGSEDMFELREYRVDATQVVATNIIGRIVQGINVGQGYAVGAANVLNGHTAGKDVLMRYPMDGNVEEITGRNGTAENGGGVPTADRLGRPSGAMEFRDGHSMAAQSPFTSGTQPFSITCWMKFNSWQGTAYVFDTMLKVRLWAENSELRFEVGGQGVMARVPVDEGQLGVWHHTALIWTGTEVQAYVDGVLKAATTAPGPLAGAEGSGLHLALNGFAGAFDDLEAYGRALSGLEVQRAGAMSRDGTSIFTAEPDGTVWSWDVSEDFETLEPKRFSDQFVGRTWHVLKGLRLGGNEEGLVGLVSSATSASQCDVVVWGPRETAPDPTTAYQTPPRAQILPEPGSGKGYAQVMVRLWDGEGSPSLPLLEYRLGDQEPWREATLAKIDEFAYGRTLRVAALPSGSTHSLVWNAGADLGLSIDATVQLRVAAGDATSLGPWCEPVPFKIQVTAGNPVAQDDTATTSEDLAVLIDVLANDIVQAPAKGVIASVGQAQHGTVVITSGKVLYTPGAQFNGLDSFTYTLSDGAGGTSIATVTVTVTPVNDPPIAQTYNFQVREDEPLTIDWNPARDQESDLVILKGAAAKSAQGGAVTVSGARITYLPKANFNGSDSFEYYVQDDGKTAGTNDFKTATNLVNVTVLAVNDAPALSMPKPFVTIENGGYSITNLIVNDVDGSSHLLLLTLSVTNGSLSLTKTNGLVFTNYPNGGSTLRFYGSTRTFDTTVVRLVYAPASNYFGSDTLRALVNDLGNSGLGGPLTDEKTVGITVVETNYPPVVKWLAPTNGSSFIFGDSIQLELTASVQNGAVARIDVLDGAVSVVSLTNSPYRYAWTNAPEGHHSLEAKAYSTRDVIATAGTVEIDVKVGGFVVVTPVKLQLNEGSDLSAGLGVSRPQLAGPKLTYSLVSGPQGLAVNPSTGTLSWKPTEEQGPGSYTVTVSATYAGTEIVRATNSFEIGVNEVNSPPNLEQPGRQSATPGVPFKLTLKATDSDLPANSLKYELVQGPSLAAIDPVSGMLTWTPALKDSPGTNAFTVRVTDDGVPLMTSQVSFDVVVKTQAPVRLEQWKYAGGSFSIQAVIPADVAYALEWSTDLRVWTKLQDGKGTGIAVTLTDREAPKTSRYYRIRLVQ